MSRFKPDSVVCFLSTHTNPGELLQHADSLFGTSCDTFYINSVSGNYVNEVFELFNKSACVTHFDQHRYV